MFGLDGLAGLGLLEGKTRTAKQCSNKDRITMSKYQAMRNQIWIYIYVPFQRYLRHASPLRVKMAAIALVTSPRMSVFVQMA